MYLGRFQNRGMARRAKEVKEAVTLSTIVQGAVRRPNDIIKRSASVCIVLEA